MGVVLAATNIGMTLTLLPWGIVSDHIGERLSIVIGLTGAAFALATAARDDRLRALSSPHSPQPVRSAQR